MKLRGHSPDELSKMTGSVLISGLWNRCCWGGRCWDFHGREGRLGLGRFVRRELHFGHARWQWCTARDHGSCRGENRLANVSTVVAEFGIAILSQPTAPAIRAIAWLRKVVGCIKHHTAHIGQTGTQNHSKKHSTGIHSGEIPFSHFLIGKVDPPAFSCRTLTPLKSTAKPAISILSTRFAGVRPAIFRLIVTTGQYGWPACASSCKVLRGRKNVISSG